MKEKEDFKIVFMGTPEFAVASLDAICKAGYPIVGVVTAPDRPAGRGQKISQSAVKKYALVHDLHVLQPDNLKDESFQQELAELKADLFAVVAFRMLPESVWTMPAKGTINLHGSLLPNYRGAAPINWAIMNGEDKTGVTTFFIDKKIDTGDIIQQATIPIGENMTAGELHDEMMVVGAQLLVDTIHSISQNNITRQQQSLSENYRSAPKIYRNDCRINFSATIQEIHNHIRGLSPYPAAWTEIENKEGQIKSIKFFSTEIVTEEHHSFKYPALIEKDGSLFLSLEGGLLKINKVQLEGKKRMDVKSFLTGFKCEDWTIRLE